MTTYPLTNLLTEHCTFLDLVKAMFLVKTICRRTPTPSDWFGRETNRAGMYLAIEAPNLDNPTVIKKLLDAKYITQLLDGTYAWTVGELSLSTFLDIAYAPPIRVTIDSMIFEQHYKGLLPRALQDNWNSYKDIYFVTTQEAIDKAYKDGTNTVIIDFLGIRFATHVGHLSVIPNDVFATRYSPLGFFFQSENETGRPATDNRIYAIPLDYANNSSLTTSGVAKYLAFVLKSGTSTLETSNMILLSLSAISYTARPNIRVEDSTLQIGIVQNTTRISLINHLCEQIRVRYGFCERPKNRLSNEIIDSFFPRLMYNCKFNVTELARDLIPSTAVAISGLVADTLNVKQIPVSELIRVLGYTTEDIRRLLRAVKRKDLTMVFAGAGGTGMNTAYWLTELCELTTIYKPFKKIYVYEEENIEVSNMLRFPFSYRHYDRPLPDLPTTKLQVISQFVDRLSQQVPVYNNRFIRLGTIYAPDDWTDRTPEGVPCTKPDTFVYGAPNLQHRNEMAQLGNFIAATHADISCAIWLNPHQDADIQVESYGMIQLGSFFMNQLRLAIGLLELLASDTDLNTQDHNILTYSFDGLSKLSTDRQYHWQIVPNMTMATEETATF